MYTEKTILNYLLNAQKCAEKLIKEHKSLAELDYSITSLNNVENFIDNNLMQISDNFGLKHQLSSYILKTLAHNDSEGKIEFETENNPIFVFSDYPNEKLNINNYVDSRLIGKTRQRESEYSF